MRQYHPLFVFLNPLIEGQKCFCVYVWLIRAVCNQEGVIVTLVRLFYILQLQKRIIVKNIILIVSKNGIQIQKW